jgi:hypothetical protein
MTAEQITREKSQKYIIDSVRKLEVSHLLQNALLCEISNELHNCYDKELKLMPDRVDELITLISNNIDGVTKNAAELSSFSYSANNVCDLIESL